MFFVFSEPFSVSSFPIRSRYACSAVALARRSSSALLTIWVVNTPPKAIKAPIRGAFSATAPSAIYRMITTSTAKMRVALTPIAAATKGLRNLQFIPRFFLILASPAHVVYTLS
jgi:hypothetical protein